MHDSSEVRRFHILVLLSFSLIPNGLVPDFPAFCIKTFLKFLGNVDSVKNNSNKNKGSWDISLMQAVVTSQLGTINNLIHVKKSDFEVFDALHVDSLECSDTSGQLPKTLMKKETDIFCNVKFN